jgi:glycosyltransferase involved in cell wall biosynthesis
VDSDSLTNGRRPVLPELDGEPQTTVHVGMLTIFFPMWNEQDYIGPTVRAAKEVCDDMVRQQEVGDYELLIIDDASTDATGRIADALAASDPRVRVVHHDRNRRLGGCLKTGFAHARGDLVLYTDADLPCDLAELHKACRLLRYYGADLVSAYRHDRTGEGPRRAVYSWIYNWMVALVFDVHVRDINFAFKLLRREALDQVRLVSEGSFIDAELLIRCQRQGFKIIQFGVDYFPRSVGVSTLSSRSVIAKILREMLGLRRELRTLEPSTVAAVATPHDPARDRAPSA